MREMNPNGSSNSGYKMKSCLLLPELLQCCVSEVTTISDRPALDPELC